MVSIGLSVSKKGNGDMHGCRRISMVLWLCSRKRQRTVLS